MPDHRELCRHLESVYGVDVTRTEELDREVYRVDLADRRRWVARVLDLEVARRQVQVLAFLSQARAGAGEAWPCGVEELAAGEPVSELGERAVLVTGFVAGAGGDDRRQVIREHGGLAALGEMVGVLAGLPGTPEHRGGGWHHLCGGGPADEIAGAVAALHAAERDVSPEDRVSYEALLAALDATDDGAGLPTGLIHPDPVLANVVASPRVGMVWVDWAGAGVGPVAWSLGWLLWAEGAKDLRRVDRVLAGYRRRAELSPDEVGRLSGLARARGTTIAVGGWKYANLTLEQAAARAARSAEIADAVATRVADVLAG